MPGRPIALGAGFAAKAAGYGQKGVPDEYCGNQNGRSALGSHAPLGGWWRDANREANMIHPAQTTRRPLRIEARADASSSFSAAGLSYLAMAIGVLSLGMLAAFL